MITTSLKTVTVRTRDRVMCNRCKAEASFEGTDRFDAPAYVHAEFEYGYGSEHFGDGTRINFDLCESCMFQITKDFAIPVVVKGKGEL